MRALSAKARRRPPKNQISRLCAAGGAVLWLLAIGAACAKADNREIAVMVRLYGVQASGLSTYDCSIQVEVHNQMDVMLKGFAASLAFFDAQGGVIARKPFEMTRIRSAARRREGLGFKFDLPVDTDYPQDMADLVDQCDILAAAEISLRACETERGSIFAACQTGLAAHPGSELPIIVRRDSVAEPVDYGVVALPEGDRAELAERAAVDRLGLTVSTITENLAWEYGLSPSVQGLLVVAVAPDGPASAAGLRVGDVIGEIDQDVVMSPDHAISALEAAGVAGRRSLLFFLDRNGQTIFTVVRLTR